MKQIIHTSQAPKAIGTYSQAVRVGNLLFLSGQIPLQPETSEIISGDIAAKIYQVFKNLEAVLVAAGTNFTSIVKLNIFLTDLSHFSKVNEIMAQFFSEPYPARSVVEVSRLPKNAEIEIEAIAMIED